MESLKHSIIRFSCIIILIIIFVTSAKADFYYINAYISYANQNTVNAILKIDINSKRIIDSLGLGINGQYVNKLPYILTSNDGNNYLITLITNGIPAKNTNGGDRATTHYFIVDERNFQLVRQDSLPGLMVSKIDRVNGDSILLTILDSQVGWIKAQFVFNVRSNRLQIVDRHVFDSAHEVYPIIGGNVNPDNICKIGDRSYYHGIINEGRILLFSADSLNNILNQLIIGDVAREAVVVGCNPSDSMIYAINLKYKFMSFSPPDTSDDTIHDEIIKINANDFSVIDTIALNPGEAYFSNENGTADLIGNYLVYYFTEPECGDCFIPAYMLIFDTRTNEATWLRVGWR
jgi:hypothetical protein